MIEAKIDSTSNTTYMVKFFGSANTLAAEFAVAIGDVYASIARNDKVEAARFRMMLVIGLKPDSPAWHGGSRDGTVVSVDLGAVKEADDGDV